MKKILKKLSCALLTAVMVCAMTPLAASAAINYSKTRIVYMPTSGKELGYDEISINNIPAGQTILKSNVKVSKGGSVISLDSFSSSSCKSTTEAFRKGVKSSNYSDHFYNIGFAVKKPGTGKISFKVGNKTYTSTIKVLRYVNPLKSISITGVKGNLAGKFKNSGHNAFRYTNKAQKSAVMKCTAANGWKITSVSFNNNRTYTQYSTNYTAHNSGVSSSTLRVGSLSAKQSAYISFTLRNTKNGAIQYCTLNMN